MSYRTELGIKYKITLKNKIHWFLDKLFRDRLLYGLFKAKRITHFDSIYMHVRRATKEPKIMYNTRKSALRAAEAMNKRYSKEYNKHFTCYKCLYCNGYHVGKDGY